MTKARFRVHLQDECPVLGCGRRIVTAEVGHKWVYLTVPFHAQRSRIRRDQWDLMKAQPMEETDGAIN